MTLDQIDSGVLLGIPVILILIWNIAGLVIFDDRLNTNRDRMIGRITILIISLPLSFITYLIILLMITASRPP
jgi:hypothetical protein